MNIKEAIKCIENREKIFDVKLEESINIVIDFIKKYLVKNNDLKKIQEIIKKYDLKTKSRNRDLVYRRMFFANFLRQNGLSFMEIANLLDKHHSTIIYYVKIAKMWEDDETFKDVCEKIKFDLQELSHGN